MTKEDVGLYYMQKDLLFTLANPKQRLHIRFIPVNVHFHHLYRKFGTEEGGRKARGRFLGIVCYQPGMGDLRNGGPPEWRTQIFITVLGNQ